MTILITRHDKIGDFITALPMCKVLKQQTNHKIMMLVSKINAPLAKKLDFIDEVIIYEKPRKNLIKKLRSYNIDVSISAYIDIDLGWTLFLSKIPIRIAPATKIAQLLFNKKVIQRRSLVEKTEWQYNLDLLKEYDNSLNLTFSPPLLKLQSEEKDPFVIFHVGSGGSSDGNISLDEYLFLAKSISSQIKVVFTFGPDDKIEKEYIKEKSSVEITIMDDFKDLWEFTNFIAKSKLFVSTSTGPMHLAGLVNIKTLSFFGETIFASSKRWATISDTSKQHNFEVPKNYTKEWIFMVESKLKEILR